MMGHIQNIANSMLTFEPLVIAANHLHLTRHGAMSRTVEGVVRPIAFTSDQQSASAARFAANHRWHEEGNIESFEPANHRHAVKAPVETEPLHPHAQRLEPCQQVRYRCHESLVTGHGMNA